MLRILKVEER